MTPSTKPEAEQARGTRTRVDIVETEHDVRLYADMPGVAPEAIDIHFEQGELTLHGRRTNTPTERRFIFGTPEATHVYRTFRLRDDLAADRIQAELKNGLLTVVLPKAEATKPRKIAVRGL